MDRRTFLRRSAVIGGGLAFVSPFEALGIRAASGAPLMRTTGYGPLVPKGELALPADFNYRVISRQGIPMGDGSPTPTCFDGMGSFRGPRGTTILIRNHENRISRRNLGEIPVIVPADVRYDPDPQYFGGCTKLVVRHESEGVYTLVDDFAIQGGTDNNCAGGVLPGRRWITCEEVVRRSEVTRKKHGYVFEVDATADRAVEARPIIGAGRFAHEAVVWHRGILYLTEDRDIPTFGGSCFYRYVPDRPVRRSQNLADTVGVLQALKLSREPRANMDIGRVIGRPYPVEWVTVDEPDHEDDTDNRRDRVPGFTPVRFQAMDRGAAFFDRVEGMWVADGNNGRRGPDDDEEDDDSRRGEERRGSDSVKIYFDCTAGGAQNLGQVWEYDPARETVTLIYESTNPLTLEGPDNIVIVPHTGDLFLCEDANAPQFIRGLTPDGAIYDFAMGITNDTEFAGACFDPDGKTLYVNQYGQRGTLPFGPTIVPDGPPAGGVTYAIYGPFGDRRHRRRS
jgi:secreted PhoX family phosphatase